MKVGGLGGGPPRSGSLTAAAQAVEDAVADDHLTSDQLGIVLTLAARLGAEVEVAEAHLITKARAAGTTWAEIANLLGLRSKQAAEQRYLRRMRTSTHDGGIVPTGTSDADQRTTASSPRRGARRDQPSESVNTSLTLGPAESTDAAAPSGNGAVARSAVRTTSGGKATRVPVIREDSTYELTRLGEGRWAVMVNGRKVGEIQRRYEPRARHSAAWEPLTTPGLFPVRCLGQHATTSGYGRTRDAAAVELLGHILRSQREAQRRQRADRISKALARTGSGANGQSGQGA